jgi:hypothetical protein
MKAGTAMATTHSMSYRRSMLLAARCLSWIPLWGIVLATTVLLTSGCGKSRDQSSVSDDEHTYYQLKIRHTDDGRYELHIKGAPPFVHSLPSRPEAIEPELKQGTWLIIVCSVVNDRGLHCVSPAIHAIEKRKSPINFGVRLFEEYDETKTWYKEYGWTAEPLWIVMKDGKVIHETKGVFEDVDKMLNQVLPESE